MFALAISLYTLWKSRKHISLDWEQNILQADIGSVFAEIDNENPIPYDYCFVTSLSVVNPSPVDIGYFDLRAFNPKNNFNLYLMTRKALGSHLENAKIYEIFNLKNGYTRGYTRLDIPEKNYGIFKANSFTKLDLIIVLPKEAIDDYKDLESISISFKIAKRAFFKKDIFALTSRKKFEFSGMEYHIKGWKERLKKQLQEQQKSSGI